MIPKPILSARFALVALVLTLLPLSGAKAASDTVLIEVNGEAITEADIDAMIMESHRNRDMSTQSEDLLVRLLEKAINDRLLMQDAIAMGMDTEDAVVEPLMESRRDRAAALYRRERFVVPTEVSQEEIAAHFERYYHRIALRSISVPTPEEAMQAILAIRSGADVDSLARAISVDTRSARGGDFGFLYWADLEQFFRDQVADLQAGQTSEIFPYRDVFGIAYVEKRADADPNDLPRLEAGIRKAILKEKTEKAWREFVEQTEEEFEVLVSDEVLESLRNDSEIVYHADFLKNDGRDALWVEDGPRMSGGALRREVQRAAMQMGTTPFDSILTVTVRSQSGRLALGAAGLAAGFLDDPAVREELDRETRTAILDAYLRDNVANTIRFKREEFEEFHREHADDFRGPEEVRLSLLIVDDEATALEAAERLREGTDFDYLRKELSRVGSSGDVSRWTPLTVFSNSIQEAVGDLGPGKTTEAISYGPGWMVCRIDDRRPGEVLALDDVEMQIRQVMFQRKFNARLDEQLGALKAASDIVRHEDRIRAYFSADAQ